MPYLAKAGEPPEPSNLIGGPIVTNHHVDHVGTFAPSSFFSVLRTTLVSMPAGFSSVLTCPVNSSPIDTASLTAS